MTVASWTTAVPPDAATPIAVVALVGTAQVGTAVALVAAWPFYAMAKVFSAARAAACLIAERALLFESAWLVVSGCWQHQDTHYCSYCRSRYPVCYLSLYLDHHPGYR